LTNQGKTDTMNGFTYAQQHLVCIVRNHNLFW